MYTKQWDPILLKPTLVLKPEGIVVNMILHLRLSIMWKIMSRAVSRLYLSVRLSDGMNKNNVILWITTINLTCDYRMR